MNFGAAILATLFAYDGWILLAALGGEMKNPEKLLPRAMTGGLLIVTAIYIFINFALLHILSANEIVTLGENATSTAATMLFGSIGGKLISVGIIVSIFGCLNGRCFLSRVFHLQWRNANSFHLLKNCHMYTRRSAHHGLRFLFKLLWL